MSLYSGKVAQKEAVKIRRLGFLGIGVVLIAIIAWQWQPITQSLFGGGSFEFHGSAMEPKQAAPDFSLINQYEQPYTLSERKGQTVLLFFGYTSCPDVCPQTLVDYRRVKEALGEKADNVDFVFVTLDPERDSPGVLKDYMELFDESFIGLSGDTETLRTVWDNYGAYEQKTDPDENGHYWVIHSSYSYVIDKNGDLRVIYSFDTPTEDIVADLQYLIG